MCTRALCEDPARPRHGAPQGRVFLGRDPGRGEIGVEIGLRLVVDRHGVVLAAFFLEPQPPALALLVVILDAHADDGRDAHKAVDHHGQQGAIAQASEGRRVDGVQQQPRFGGLQHRRLARPDDVGRPVHRGGRVSGFSKKGLKQALAQLEIDARFNVRADMVEIDRGDGKGWITSNRLEQASLRDLIAERCRVPISKGEKPALFNSENWERCRDALMRDRQVDPFLLWVESMPEWDGTPRIGQMIQTLWGVETSAQEELAQWASRYALIGAIQRAHEPGAKLDEFPILVGSQDAGKSVFVEYLLPYKSPWFGANVDLSSETKDLVEQLQGLAIAEIGEMAGLRRAEVEDVKRTVTRGVDWVRLSWASGPGQVSAARGIRWHGEPWRRHRAERSQREPSFRADFAPPRAVSCGEAGGLARRAPGAALGGGWGGVCGGLAREPAPRARG